MINRVRKIRFTDMLLHTFSVAYSRTCRVTLSSLRLICVLPPFDGFPLDLGCVARHLYQLQYHPTTFQEYHKDLPRMGSSSNG